MLTLYQKMKFYIKDFLGKYGNVGFVQFTKEILNRKLHFFCAVIFAVRSRKSLCLIFTKLPFTYIAHLFLHEQTVCFNSSNPNSVTGKFETLFLFKFQEAVFSLMSSLSSCKMILYL